MEDQEKYTLNKLCDDLDISISEFCRRVPINEGTLARIRVGHAARRSTANKILREFSKIYGFKLSLDNVTGIHILGKEIPQSQVEGGAIKQSASIPANLPPGTVPANDFVKKYEISTSNWSRWVNKGLKGERIETEEVPRTDGKGPLHYLTPTQQEKALDLLKRHGKLIQDIAEAE